MRLYSLSEKLKQNACVLLGSLKAFNIMHFENPKISLFELIFWPNTHKILLALSMCYLPLNLSEMQEFERVTWHTHDMIVFN